ncbi:hypothetical protein WDZ92_30230 [Nostoc sp. NIES-2111]
MPTPRADTYSAASGAGIYAGMPAPSSLPAWLAGKALNEWFEIPSTPLMATGAAAQAFSGMALADTGSGIHCVVAAAGGHTDSYDNRVVSLNLMADAPAWTLRHAATPLASVVSDARYYADGRPNSRHLYWNCTYVPQLDRVVLIGSQGNYSSGGGSPNVDAFNLNTNQWDGVVADQPGTSGSGYPDTSVVMVAPTINPATGDLWTTSNYYYVYKWSATTKTTTQVGNSFGSQFSGQVVFDSGRNQLAVFGAVSGGVLQDAWLVALDGLSRRALTFNASAAYSAMLASADGSQNVVYDDVADRFYWYRSNGTGTVYVITPNSGATWDVSIMSLGAGSATPVASPFLFNRFSFVKRLGGLVYFPASAAAPSANGYFLRPR